MWQNLGEVVSWLNRGDNCNTIIVSRNRRNSLKNIIELKNLTKLFLFSTLSRVTPFDNIIIIIIISFLIIVTCIKVTAIGIILDIDYIDYIVSII